MNDPENEEDSSPANKGWSFKKVVVFAIPVVTLVLAGLTTYYARTTAHLAEVELEEKETEGLYGIGLVEYAKSYRLQEASVGKFTVILTHMAHDGDNRKTRYFKQRLDQENEYLGARYNLVFLNWTIDKGTVKAGHEFARGILAHTGAHVVVWGSVMAENEAALHITTASSKNIAYYRRGEEYDFGTELEEGADLLATRDNHVIPTA